MANLLWGKVFYKDDYAGILQEEPGDRFSFTYDKYYLESKSPAISHLLPKQEEAHISQNGLHPFFDNLVAEGWLEEAQSRLIGKRGARRFELLLAFGNDLAGAVSVIDPEPSNLTDKLIEAHETKAFAVLKGRASLSGVQPKLAAIKKRGIYYPAKIGDLSTYIIKFPSPDHDDLVTNEYLTTLAFKALLPKEEIVDIEIGSADGFDEQALIIKRFDRDEKEGRIHFEEFNQLLNYKSHHKYDAAYKDMSSFMLNSKKCIPAENYRLYLRILAGILLGNTDMHLKNFAMFHTKNSLKLTPSYDQVGASIYKYKTLALKVNNVRDLNISSLKPIHLIKLGEEFDLSPDVINMTVKTLEKNLEAAKDAFSEAKLGSESLKQKLIKNIGARWNVSYSLIGKKLSEQQ